MKNLISKLFMVCAVALLAACSSSDDEAVNPVTNPVVPPVAKIGSEVTIQGNGFAAGQTILLKPEGEIVVAVNANFTANGATFTVPYTLDEGTVSVILVQDNIQWPLGSMTIVAGDNPISAMSIPTEMALGEEATIGGIGFVNSDALLFSDGKGTNVAVQGTPTADGLKIAVGKDLAEGEYQVSLQRGKSEWQLATVYVYQPRRIESITVSDNAYLSMFGLENIELAFGYNDDGTLKSITALPLAAYEFTYSGNTITVDNYKYTLDDRKRIVSHTGADMFGDPVEYEWTYDADGHLKSICQKGTAESADGNFTQTYADGNLSGYTFSFGNEYQYETKGIRVCPNTVEPAILVNAFSWMFTQDHLLLGFLLNSNVKVSQFVADKWLAGDIDSTTGEDIFIDIPLNSGYANNALTLKASSSGYYTSPSQGFFANTVTVKYANK